MVIVKREGGIRSIRERLLYVSARNKIIRQQIPLGISTIKSGTLGSKKAFVLYRGTPVVGGIPNERMILYSQKVANLQPGGFENVSVDFFLA